MKRLLLIFVFALAVSGCGKDKSVYGKWHAPTMYGMFYMELCDGAGVMYFDEASQNSPLPYSLGKDGYIDFYGTTIKPSSQKTTTWRIKDGLLKSDHIIVYYVSSLTSNSTSTLVLTKY